MGSTLVPPVGLWGPRPPDMDVLQGMSLTISKQFPRRSPEGPLVSIPICAEGLPTGGTTCKIKDPQNFLVNIILYFTHRLYMNGRRPRGLGDGSDKIWGGARPMHLSPNIWRSSVIGSVRKSDIHCVRMKSSTQQTVSQFVPNCKYLLEILNSTTVTIFTRDTKAVWKYSWNCQIYERFR